MHIQCTCATLVSRWTISKLNWKLTFFLEVPHLGIMFSVFVARANVIAYKLARANILIELNWIRLHWIALLLIKLHHITSHHITSHYTTLHHITPHHIPEHHMTYKITLHMITSRHKASHHFTSGHIQLHYTTSFRNTTHSFSYLAAVFHGGPGSDHLIFLDKILQSWSDSDVPTERIPGSTAVIYPPNVQ